MKALMISVKRNNERSNLFRMSNSYRIKLLRIIRAKKITSFLKSLATKNLESFLHDLPPTLTRIKIFKKRSIISSIAKNKMQGIFDPRKTIFP